MNPREYGIDLTKYGASLLAMGSLRIRQAVGELSYTSPDMTTSTKDLQSNNAYFSIYPFSALYHRLLTYLGIRAYL